MTTMEAELAPQAPGPTSSRLHLTQTMHANLETKLAVVSSYMDVARSCKYNETQILMTAPLPEEAVTAAVESLDTVSRCLRMFNPERDFSRLKMSSTLRVLYIPNKLPVDRILSFLSIVQESYGGFLLREVALCGSHCLQRFDSSAADAYLTRIITSILDARQYNESEVAHFGKQFEESVRTQRSDASGNDLHALLVRQIEYAAQSPKTGHRLCQYNQEALRSFLPADTIQELFVIEEACWRDCAARQQKAAVVQKTKGIPACSPPRNEDSVASHEGRNEDSALAPNQQKKASNLRGIGNHGRSRVQIALVALLCILLLSVVGPARRLLVGFLQTMRGGQRVRRTLTL